MHAGWVRTSKHVPRLATLIVLRNPDQVDIELEGRRLLPALRCPRDLTNLLPRGDRCWTLTFMSLTAHPPRIPLVSCKDVRVSQTVRDIRL